MEETVYTLRLIDGDYAHLRDERGGELLIALALLPPGADEGDRILYKDYQYSLLPV